MTIAKVEVERFSLTSSKPFDAVVAAFKANPRVNDSGIKVQSVNKGVVLLSGKTDSLRAHLDAVQAARTVPGVKRVATEVEVTGGTE